MKIWNYESGPDFHSSPAHVKRIKGRIEDKGMVFIKHDDKWEFYKTLKSGKSKGLEMFQGYVTDPQQYATLEQARKSITNFKVRPRSLEPYDTEDPYRSGRTHRYPYDKR
jgi:hypothetical protein